MNHSAGKITPVLLAGGAGSRLWPVSRDQLPKQFQPLVGPHSTYQQTLKRVSEPSLYADALSSPTMISASSPSVRPKTLVRRFRSFWNRPAAIAPPPWLPRP